MTNSAYVTDADVHILKLTSREDVERLADALECSSAPIKNQAARMLRDLRRERDRFLSLCRSTKTPQAETRYVAQEDSMGCGVACLAMVSGRTYADVRAGLPASWLGKLDAVGGGLSEHGMRYWLNREGFFTRWTWMQGDDPRPVPTFGVAIMLTAGASADNPNHWVVLVDGRVLDPMRPTPLPAYDFLQAIEVHHA